jgi:hypothetical protein
MALPPSAISHYQQQQLITIAAATQVRRQWRTMGDDFELSWQNIATPVFETVAIAQRNAAAAAIEYVPAVLEDQGLDATAVATINPDRFMGGTDDGRPLETLLHGAVYESKSAIGNGATVGQALAVGGGWLQDVIMDAVRDAGRQAASSSITVRPSVQGWVRMLNPPSCKFCIMLAGKFFRWNQGFQAHKRCDCRHIPSSESSAGDLTIDPYAYFHSLSAQDQNRIFGKRDAQAIRDGGDIYKIINTRSRGLADDKLKRTPGHNRGWQSRRWDTPSELTVDDIYDRARNRDEAIEMLGQYGYITGDQRAGGNQIGNAGGGIFGDLAAGALGRGGTRKGAARAYREAIRTGTRDPLEPATQTAAERRLHSAYLAHQAVTQGRNPFATNTAREPLTQEIRDLVERQYQRELAKLASGPEQLRVLARLLGIL